MRPSFYQRRASPNFGNLPAILGKILRYAIYVLIAYAIYGYASRIWNSNRAERLAAAASGEIRAGDPLTAKGMLKEAFSLCPENPKAARIMAGLLDAEGSPLALAYHFIVLESGDATEEDRRAMIKSAVRHEDEPGALDKVVEVAEGLDDPSLPHLLQARIHARRGEVFESEEELRRAVGKRPASDTWTALARGLMARPERNGSTMDEAMGLLGQAARSDAGAGGLAAIDVALESEGLSPRSAAEWIEMHQSHPAADTISRLRADALALQINPGLREDVIDRVVARSRQLPLDEKPIVALWLVGHGAASKVCKFWGQEEAVGGGKEAFQIWLNAGLSAGHLPAVDEALEHAASPLEAYESLAIRSNVAAASGDAERSKSLGREAAAACQAYPEGLLEVVRIFLEGGNFPLALEHLNTLIIDPVSAGMVVERLIPCVSGGHSASDMLEFYEAILKIPAAREDSQLSDRADRLRLLMGGQVSEVDLQERLKKEPSNPSIRLTLALAHLLQGRPSRAGYELGMLDSDISPKDLTPPDKVVLVALLAVNGRILEARKISSDIGQADVSAEGFALIERYLRGRST